MNLLLDMEKIAFIIGVIIAKPNTPYKTDGIAANNSIAGRTIFANDFGATSAIKTDVNKAIGTPIIIAPNVAKMELTIIYPIPYSPTFGCPL